MVMSKTRILLVISLVSLLVLSACTGGMPFSNKASSNVNRDYYVGTDGVIMRFSDPSSPPARMYFYEGAEYDDNAFQILVDVHNIGASWTKGALFVSGYDPYMIKIDHIDIAQGGVWSDCFFSLGFLGGGSSRTSADCNGVNLGIGGGGFELSTKNLGALLQTVGVDAQFLNDIALDINTYGGNLDLGVSVDGTVDADLFNHGAGLLVALSGLSFTRYNGLNYDGDVAGQGILAPDYPQFPGGEMNTIAFDGIVRNWPQGLDRTDKPVTFLVTNCFLYSTTATPQVCIDPAPYDQGVKVCQPQRITFNGGNGAPIVISSIEQENARRKVYFDINVRNAGGGTVFNLENMEYCSPYYPGRLTTQHLNTVYILDARIADQHLKCTPDRGDGIHLVNGQGSFRCEYNMEYVTAKSAFQTPLIIELGYGYSTTMQRSTTIKRVI